MIPKYLLTLLAGALLVLGAGCVDEYFPNPSQQAWRDPMDRMGQRDLKLVFGLYVTPDPDQNPIDPPERFTGYHTALDVEVFPEEMDKDVPVYAICDGEVRYKSNVEGYGGTFIQQCNWHGNEVTVLYGHLELASIKSEVKDALRAGDKIGILGDHYSEETSQNRKHLHLGIHKGTELEKRGYVQNESELEAFIDPAEVLGYKLAE